MNRFRRASILGQSQTGMGPKIYPFTTQVALLPRSNAGKDGVKPASGFIIQKHQTLCSIWCLMYMYRIWSVVCSRVPHLEFSEGAKPYLCMDKLNHQNQYTGDLSFNEAVWGKLNPTGLALVNGIKAWSLDVLSQYSAFHL